MKPPTSLPLLAGGLLIAAAIGCFAAALSVEADIPRLNFDPPIVDLGFLSDDEPLETLVRLHNPCSFPVGLLEIQPSCSCTAARLAAGTIEPGGSTGLTLQFDPHGRAEGPYTTQVTLLFHAAESSQVYHQRLTVRAVINPKSRADRN